MSQKSLRWNFITEIWSYSEIILTVTERCKGNTQVYCPRVQDKSNCLLLWQAHLVITLLTEVKYYCTSEDNEKDLLFDCMQKRFCKFCVRHYCEKLWNIYQFKIFWLLFLVSIYKISWEVSLLSSSSKYEDFFGKKFINVLV